MPDARDSGTTREDTIMEAADTYARAAACSRDDWRSPRPEREALETEVRALAEQLRGAVEAYRDVALWARATFDLAGRPDYGDGIDQLLRRHGLESLPEARPHDRRGQ